MQCMEPPSSMATLGDCSSVTKPPVTAAVDGSTIEITGSCGPLTELELLRKIYDEICDIRQKHADIIAETASKKAENQRLFEKQNSKLQQLEDEHRETGRRLKEQTASGEKADSELASLVSKYQAEREELDVLRKEIDDLEFQMFEADARFDEEKELVQRQLMDKQQALFNIENQFQQLNRASELTVTPPAENIVENSTPLDCSSTSQRSKSPACNEPDGQTTLTFQPSKTDLQWTSRPDGRDACSADLFIVSNENCIQPDRLTVLTGFDTVQVKPFSSPSHRYAESSPKFIRSLPSTLPPLPDCLPLPGHEHRNQFNGDCSSGDWSLTGESDDGNSTASSERVLEHDKHSEINERIIRMKKLLAAAEAEKTRLLQKQAESDDEGLRDETQKRLQTHRRTDVQFDIKPHRYSDDVVIKNDGVIANNNRYNNDEFDDQSATLLRRGNRQTVQSRQSRPLTRYLPVKNQPLDLLRFIEEQAGHSIERCSQDVTVTSDTAQGFLTKMGGRIRTWRRRWFVFDRRRRHLAYYVEQSEQKRPRGIIKFESIQDVYVFDLASSVKSPDPELTFCVKTPKRTYYIVAPNAEVRQLWMEIIFTGAEGYKQFE